jgi:hypothetical protein
MRRVVELGCSLTSVGIRSLSSEEAELDHAAHRTGMALRRAVVLVAQVGVGIEVEDAECGIVCLARRNRAGGQRVLAPEQKGEFAIGEDPRRRLVDARDHAAGGAELRFEGVGRVDADLGWLAVEVGIVEFDLAGSVDDRSGTIPRTGPV